MGYVQTLGRVCGVCHTGVGAGVSRSAPTSLLAIHHTQMSFAPGVKIPGM